MFLTIRQIRRSYYGRLLGMSFMLAVLGLLMYALMLLAFHADQIGTQVQEKLGVYIYFQQDGVVDADIHLQALDMFSDLEREDISAQYYTKEDAFFLLEQRLPNVSADLEKYGIANPLPSTLYVTFSKEEERNIVRDLVYKYEHIIDNAADLDGKGFSFGEQEQRVIDVLRLTYIARVISLILVGCVGVLALMQIRGLLEYLVSALKTYLHVQKLSGVSHLKISLPFLFVGRLLFVFSVCLCTGLLVGIGCLISQYIPLLTDTSILSLMAPASVLWGYALWIALASLLILVVGSFLLRRKSV